MHQTLLECNCIFQACHINTILTLRAPLHTAAISFSAKGFLCTVKKRQNVYFVVKNKQITKINRLPSKTSEHEPTQYSITSFIKREHHYYFS
jgi:hypothetical protein